jgi:hypothetical protein
MVLSLPQLTGFTARLVNSNGVYVLVDFYNFASVVYCLN